MNYAGKNVKIMSHWDNDELAKRITEFLKTHDSVVDIQFQYSRCEYKSMYTAMIIYE